MKKDLSLFPYKIQTMQHLNEASITQRLDFANTFIDQYDNGQIDPNFIWFSDEAHFWLDGYVNRQNYRFWGSEKPQFSITKSLHPQKVTVWAALCGQMILGPFFIEGTVTTARYKALLQEECVPKIQELGMVGDYWFQQDGAPPHRTRVVFDTLFSTFKTNVIALGYPNHYHDSMHWLPLYVPAGKCSSRVTRGRRTQ
ncbi:hypothetical protein X777_03788 [Ooceraea biroi]|uniref:Tc1-like transposase DDE domain-containing protein n=1 Tax=Ooceraea biroi TaxID=2015173 RepID=A0A026WKA8_OOCBI|nr:hypothetical protein X777_03788 [Ooceraea biroi]